MRKTVIILLFIISSGLSSAQIVGTKFIADSSYYKESMDYWINISGPTHIYGYSTQYVLGDTVISNKYYQKVYTTQRNLFDTICRGTLNLLHHDSGKVYFNNKLVYNFNLMLGDTINVYYPSLPIHPAGYYTYTLTTKDSINIGSKWRKQLTFTGPSIIPVKLRWVYSLGDIYYGLAAPYPSIDQYKMLGGSYTLTCFSEHFQNTYGAGCGVNSFCGSNNLTSVIPCNPEYSTVTFSINGGVLPYSFNILTPTSCSIPNYTAVATTTNPTFTLNCAGVYTFTAKDSNNTSLGITTHSTTNATIINFSVAATRDTICVGESSTLSINGSTSNFTVNPINWSDGSIGSPILVSPLSTYTYYLSGLYTSVSTRTCSVAGSKKIIVNSCVGIKEIGKGDVNIFPNPTNETLYISDSQNKFQNSQIEITNYLGQTALRTFFTNTVDVSKLSQGIYTLKINTKDNQSFYSKFIKE